MYSHFQRNLPLSWRTNLLMYLAKQSLNMMYVLQAAGDVSFYSQDLMINVLFEVCNSRAVCSHQPYLITRLLVPLSVITIEYKMVQTIQRVTNILGGARRLPFSDKIFIQIVSNHKPRERLGSYSGLWLPMPWAETPGYQYPRCWFISTALDPSRYIVS